MTRKIYISNTGSIRLYEKCGFAPDGTGKIYDCGKEMKAIRMRRKL
jgi:RimJ/RimL family protein N-acetyltransferase